MGFRDRDGDSVCELRLHVGTLTEPHSDCKKNLLGAIAKIGDTSLA
jgi:hypothetical protein